MYTDPHFVQTHWDVAAIEELVGLYALDLRYLKGVAAGCCAHSGRLLLGWTTQILPQHFCIRTVGYRACKMKSRPSIRATDSPNMHCTVLCTVQATSPLLI